MAVRFYFSQNIGTGTEADPLRPALSETVEAYSGVPRLAGGWWLVRADPTEAQHTALLADARVIYIPLEDSAGNPLALTDPISAIDAAKRNQIQTRLEARGVSFAGLALTDPIQRVLGRIVRRRHLRRALGNDDFTEGMDTTIGSINQGKRNRISNALTARGYDPSVLLGTDTIREALRKLAVQDPSALIDGRTIFWQRNGWD